MARTAQKLSSEDAVARLRAIAEPTRLRIVALLLTAELNVKDLTQVLGQSQPRISRHLKLLAEAGVIERFREGAWVNLRLSEAAVSDGVVSKVVSTLDPDDLVISRDRERAAAVLEDRARAAERYFAEHAGRWDEIRAMHVDEAQVEATMRSAIGPGPFQQFLDLGTGTGRVLELFADRYERGIGLDSNQAMLAYARSRIEAAGLAHAQVRQGDIYNLALRDQSCDAIAVHQVLHFLSEPAAALGEVARVLADDGQLLIVDYAPHELHAFRERFAHRALGISDAELTTWLSAAGLAVTEHHVLEAPSSAGDDALDVSLWIARRAGAPDRRNDETSEEKVAP
ncbi:MAG: metalloregulator ArsR/SmtB family transcription factor [Pseudomonadota bacterium]